MTIKVKIRENNKAVIKFDSATQYAQEKMWFISTMRSIRDSDPTKHPKISIRDHNGEIPRLPPPKPLKDKDGKPIMPQKLTPEMIKKMEIQPVKGKPINVSQLTPEMIKKLEAEGKK